MSFLRHSDKSFLRHAEIYRSDVGCKTKSQGRGAASRWSVPGPAKGRDGRTAPYPSSTMSFRTGYSLAGCSPAEPASASPVANSMPGMLNAGNDLSANGNLSLISVSQWRGALHTVFRVFPVFLVFLFTYDAIESMPFSRKPLMARP
jgi:hypothetical protein